MILFKAMGLHQSAVITGFRVFLLYTEAFDGPKQFTLLGAKYSAIWFDRANFAPLNINWADGLF